MQQKKKQLGKDKSIVIEESVFEKLLSKAVKSKAFSQKKSGKAKRQTSSH